MNKEKLLKEHTIEELRGYFKANNFPASGCSFKCNFATECLTYAKINVCDTIHELYELPLNGKT